MSSKQDKETGTEAYDNCSYSELLDSESLNLPLVISLMKKPGGAAKYLVEEVDPTDNDGVGRWCKISCDKKSIIRNWLRHDYIYHSIDIKFSIPVSLVNYILSVITTKHNDRGDWHYTEDIQKVVDTINNYPYNKDSDSEEFIW